MNYLIFLSGISCAGHSLLLCSSLHYFSIVLIYILTLGCLTKLLMLLDLISSPLLSLFSPPPPLLYSTFLQSEHDSAYASPSFPLGPKVWLFSCHIKSLVSLTNISALQHRTQHNRINGHWLQTSRRLWSSVLFFFGLRLHRIHTNNDWIFIATLFCHRWKKLDGWIDR